MYASFSWERMMSGEVAHGKKWVTGAAGALSPGMMDGNYVPDRLFQAVQSYRQSYSKL